MKLVNQKVILRKFPSLANACGKLSDFELGSLRLNVQPGATEVLHAGGLSSITEDLFPITSLSTKFNEQCNEYMNHLPFIHLYVYNSECDHDSFRAIA